MYSWIPEGYHSVTPYLVVDDAGLLFDFVKASFDAVEVFRIDSVDGMIAHAEVRIGDSIVMFGDAALYEDGAAMPAILHLYVHDVDATYHRALGAGAASHREPMDEDYCDRKAGVRDPVGNYWWLAKPIAEASRDEFPRGAAELSS